MRIVVTGGAGFLGRAFERALRFTDLTVAPLLVDRTFQGAHNSECRQVDLSDVEAASALAAEADVLVHLASFPGGAAEQNPQASKQTNLDATIALLEGTAGRRFVFTSSVAVFGATSASRAVGESTAAIPNSTYGTHKRMAELAFSDAVRRGELAGFALRLPGVVARPRSVMEGFGSSFLSEVFHAAAAGTEFSLPLGSDATTWLMSSKVCAQNLVHAALDESSWSQPINLPALQVRMDDLVAMLGRFGDTSGIRFEENAATRQIFGSHPPLDGTLARSMGFKGDGSLEELVATVMEEIRDDTCNSE